MSSNDHTDPTPQLATVYFAGGCFWGTQRLMQLVPGVVFTEVGYANSTLPNPTYQQVCSGETGAAETVKVVYQPDVIELRTLLGIYFLSIHPTSVNKQGEDEGAQYRTGIYYVDDDDRKPIESYIDSKRVLYTKPIAVEVKRLENFYPAEEYHQDYLMNNPDGYCHVDTTLFRLVRAIRPKKFSKPSDDKLQDILSPMEYSVTQENATEPPFTNKYFNEFRPGLYIDVTTGEPLFSSRDKFHSECGWPAFSKPISPEAVVENDDFTNNMIRTEVRSATGNAHLGHVFHDGPAELGGRRYCINSAAVIFIPLNMMDGMGYADYIPFCE